mgnify:CR=1 FL=1
MKIFEIYHELRKPSKHDYNNFGDNVELYRSLNIGLNNGHNGQDSLAISPEKSVYTLALFPIYSGIDGWVYKISVDSKGGWGIELITNEKRLDINGQPYFWKVRYWHMVKDSFSVKVGQKVGIGDYLGLGDNTGLSRSSHVHRDSKPGDVQNDIFIKTFPGNGYYGAVDDKPYLQTMSAFEVRTAIQSIAEAIERLGRQIAEFIKNRK